MPRGDSTGPMGMGPMTGRGAGYCAGYNMPGYFNNATGRNFGMGSGRGFAGRGFCAGGFGMRNRFYATGVPGRAWSGSWAMPTGKPDPESEKQVLKRQVDLLQSEMEAIRQRLDELDAEARTK